MLHDNSANTSNGLKYGDEPRDGERVDEPHVDAGSGGWTGPLPAVMKLGVRDMPTSATPEELMDAAGITASHIVRAVKALLS